VQAEEERLTAVAQFPTDSGFDAEATTAMGSAFDAACGAVGGRGQPGVVQEVIARRIIAAAKKASAIRRDSAKMR
jgi:imidazole glycerol phosphate synthase subunit HisF